MNTRCYLFRWALISLLVALSSALAAYTLREQQPPRYRAVAVLQIGGYMALIDPDPQMIRSAATFAQTYIARLQTESTLEALRAQLAPSLTPQELRQRFSATFAEGTSLLKLSVIDESPERAAALANALADEMSAISPVERAAFQAEQITFWQAELRRLQSRLSRASAELEIVEANMTQPDLTAEARSVLFARHSELAEEIQRLQNNLSALTQTLEKFQSSGAVNTVQIVERALPPEHPLPSGAELVALLTGGLSGSLLFSLALIKLGLRDTFITLDALQPIFNAPLLGMIPPFGQRGLYTDKLITWLQPRHVAAQAYYALRLNLSYRALALHQPSRLWLFTSPRANSGKSVTAANLAVAFAMRGEKVILIDANLRAGQLHRILGVENRNGLSNIWQRDDLQRIWLPVGDGRTLLSDAAAENAFRQRVRLFLSVLIQPTAVPNLDVIPAGARHTAPTELLASPHMHELVRQLLIEHRYDLILFDAPALDAHPDALLLARIFGAQPLLILDTECLRRRKLVRAARLLAANATPTFGVVLNRHSSASSNLPWAVIGAPEVIERLNPPKGSG